MPSAEMIELVKTIAELAVFPLIGVLWRLNETITSLKVTIYQDFVSKKDFAVFLSGNMQSDRRDAA